MQLQCAHCPYISKSVILNKDEALAEITMDFSQHLMHFHSSKDSKVNTPFRSYMLDIQMLMQLVPCVIMLSKHSKLLDESESVTSIKIDDDYIQLKFSEMIEKVQDVLGVEVFDNRPAAVETVPSPPSLSLPDMN